MSQAPESQKWICSACSFSNQLDRCNCCGIASDEKKKENQESSVSLILLSEDGKLCALDKEKKVIWSIGGIAQVEKWSATEILVIQSTDAILLNKDDGKPIMKIEGGKVKQLIYF